MYAIHPKSAALVRKYLSLPDDAPITLPDLVRAAEMEATGEHCTRCGRRLSDFGSRDCTCRHEHEWAPMDSDPTILKCKTCLTYQGSCD